MLRTHTVGELNRNHVGKTVTLCGWVDRHRDIGQLIFVTLRDRYGIAQCVYESSEGNAELLAQLKNIANEYCLKIEGTVRMRDEKDRKTDYATGEIEVRITHVEVLNECAVLPFQVRDDLNISDDLRLKYRYLDLRRSKMQHNIKVRHDVIQATRSALCELGFLEIETPLLVRSTPEGARDFVVPSRVHPGNFYALPQSPQLYKQMLMISGFDRYFQFAQAFRDEDLRADRVPVHTQIDMEMTFVEEKDVFLAVETYMKRVFSQVKKHELTSPFPIISYHTAMEQYGCDKPDTRFEMKLKTLTPLAKKTEFGVFKNAECVRCIVVDQGEQITRKDIDTLLTDKAKIYGAQGLAWTRLTKGEFSGGVAKFLNDHKEEFIKELGLKEESLVLFVADKYSICCKALSAVRNTLGEKLKLYSAEQYNFLWVNEFPLFEWSEERQAFDAMHHLFTRPMKVDEHFLETDPGKVRGQLYDLVLNGQELCSGSIRINRQEMQQKVLDIVKMPAAEAQSKFGFLMDAFAYGAPPHGGSAVGLDRLVTILCGESSIREVIAYPCNHHGIFPLDGSPAPLEKHQLDELSLTITPPKNSKK
jgi:aspartyl-tRNA synthetase